MPKRDPRLLAFAKAMRRERTPAEERFWPMVRAGRVDGVKFSNQVLVCGFIADFAARARKLVVEIDGDSHDLTAMEDARRTAILRAKGYQLIRFMNDDVMTNADGVLAMLREAIRTAPLPAGAPRQPALSPVGRGPDQPSPHRGVSLLKQVKHAPGMFQDRAGHDPATLINDTGGSAQPNRERGSR